MTDWRDQLRPASFRGVAFHYAETGDESGRRLAVHEYPGRDGAYAEDLGRMPRVHTIEAYVLGPDHLARAAALVAALEAPGPGTLVHPYLGERRVAVRSYRRRHAANEGRLARFAITVVETTAAAPVPTVRPDTAGGVADAADSGLSTLADVFRTRFDLAGRPGWVADDLAARVAEAGGAVESALAPFVATGEAAAGLARDAAALVHDPAALTARLASLLFAAAPAAPATAWLPLARHGESWAPVPETTATRRAQAAARAALAGLVRRTALVRAARAATAATWPDHGAALAARDDLVARLDGEIRVGDDATVRALTAVLAAVVRHVATLAPALPRLVTWTPPTTVPALVAAHALYGNAPAALAARAAEIATRNRIRHPGFLGGGVALEVLADVR